MKKHGFTNVFSPTGDITAANVAAIVQLPNGKAMVAWEACYDEGSFRNQILCSTSEDEGETWGVWNARVLQDDPMVRDTYPAFLRTENSVLFFYMSGRKLEFRRSKDGDEWSSPILLGYGVPLHPIRLSDGTIVLPCQMEDAPQGFRSPSFLISKDDGESWIRGGDAIPPGNGVSHLDEPTIAELSDGAIKCFFRTTTGYIFESTSTDGAMSWSEAKSSGIHAPWAMSKILRLSNGHIILVWNNVWSGGAHWPRNPLNVAVSMDDCNGWSYPRVLREAWDWNTQFTNMGVTQLESGRILVAYEHLYKVPNVEGGYRSNLEVCWFDEEWILSGDSPFV